MLSIFIMLDLLIMILISVAFLTLLERKILGYIQIRKGPNKVGMMGLFQPFADAIKLFSKESMMILKSNYLFFLISPMFSMLLMLLLWINMTMIIELMNNYYNFILIMCLLCMGVYSLMLSGWSSNSMYTLIGMMRSIAQTISYEVSMILLMLSIMIYIESYNLIMLIMYQKNIWFIMFNYILSLIIFVSLLAELNRTPFDFSEGESELVSGFNTEYMSGSFAMIFIAEYGMMLFMMYLFNMMFFGSNLLNLMFIYMYMYMMFLIIWVRGTYPRFRYDNLMMLTWKNYLPVSLNYFLYINSMMWVLI
nr:NADH dehydrogenase subunit 1 [Pachycrepoideus vindemmiae]